MRLSPRQMAAMNGALLEDSVLEQVARLESAIRQLKPPPDIQPILDHLAKVEKKIAAVAAPDMVPVIQRLDDIEELVSKPSPALPSLEPIATRLTKMEAAIKAKNSTEYEFTIKRDANGLIAKVTATPIIKD